MSPTDTPLPTNTDLVTTEDPATGETVHAVRMPAALGAEADRILSIHFLSGTVVMDHAEWIFFTEPTDADYDLPADLVDDQVSLVHPGDRVPVPAPRSTGTTVRWIHEPGTVRHNPPLRAVICAARRAAQADRTAPLAAA